MATARELRLLALAYRRGWLTREQSEHALDLQHRLHTVGRPGKLAAILVARKLLTHQQVVELASDVEHGRSTTALMTGVTLDRAQAIPDFALDRELGTGGMSTVFGGRMREDADAGADRNGHEIEIALKVVHPERAIQPETVAQFEYEADLLIDFDHCNIVRGFKRGSFLEANAVAGQPALHFVAMQLVDGPTLQQRVDALGALPELDVIATARDIAAALAYLEAQQVVHRDLKPGNFMLDEPTGRTMLIDLGFAVRPDRDAPPAIATSGTPQYMSPEQCRGQLDIDGRADLYSLGASMYHLLTGRLPFSGKTSDDVLEQQVTQGVNPEPLRERDVRPDTQALLFRMMAKTPDRRPSSAEEVHQDLVHLHEVLSS